MLYSLYEAQHTALTPYRYLAELTRGWFGHPFSPFHYLPLRQPPRRVERPVPARHRPLREAGVGHRRALEVCWKSRSASWCVSSRQPPASSKVLLVAPLSGHHATLLRDTVRSLLAEHDVWVTDWVDARMVPLTAGPFHLADYVRLRARVDPPARRPTCT